MRSGFYGYGFNVGTSAAGRVQFGHSGAFGLGVATNLVIIPSADVAIVALTNAAPTGVPETLTAQFTDLVEFGEIRQDWARLYADAFAGMNRPFGEFADRQPPANPTPRGRCRPTRAPTQTPTGVRPRSRRRAGADRFAGPTSGLIPADPLGRRGFHLPNHR